MVPVTPMIPLFNLPYVAWIHVLKSMDLFDLIKLSVCRSRLKLHIRSLFRKPSELRFVLGSNNVHMDVRCPYFDNLQLDPSNLTLQGPSTLYSTDTTFFGTDRRAEQISAGFDLKDWVRHLMEAFNFNGINLVFSCDEYNIEHVKRVFEGLIIHGLSLYRTISNPYLVKALETFQPTQSLDLDQRPEKEEPFLCNIITKRYESITLGFPITLQEVFSLTSPFIYLQSLSVTDFNTLLNKWVDGWNPELARLCVMNTIDHEQFVPVLFNGINYQESEGSKGRQAMRWSIYEIRREGKIAFISIHQEEREDGRMIQVRIENI